MVKNMQIADRMKALESAIFAEQEQIKRDFIARGIEIFNFNVGTPDLPPPDNVMKVLSEEAAKPQNYRYAIKDSEELLEAVAGWYARRFGVSLNQDEILGLNGSQDALAHVALSLVNPGEGVLVQDP